MAFGPESTVVNGQLLALPQSYQYAPAGYGPQTVGVPQVSPSYPPFLGAPMGQTAGASAVGGYGTADNNTLAASVANKHPFNLKGSATIWAVGGLVVSLVLLKAIHWRETLEEAGAVGPFHEGAHEAA